MTPTIADAGASACLDRTGIAIPSGAPPRPRWLDQSLLHIAYRVRHGRALDLDDPRRFTELVQWRKLYDRDPRQPGLIDKVAVKRFVADRIGYAWVTPTLWHGPVLPARPSWPGAVVVKSRHGCNQRRFVFDADRDWSAVRRAGARWMRRGYGGWLGEWAYRDVPRGILVEPFIGLGRTLPIDYKFYIFDGRVAAIQVHFDRATDHRWVLLDRDWRQVSRGGEKPARPGGLTAMIAAAEALAAGFGFVRVDLYDTTPHPRFGEMTFYPGSGLDRFDGEDIDEWLGAMWRGETQVRSPLKEA